MASKALRWRAIQQIQVPQIHTNDLELKLTKDFQFLYTKTTYLYVKQLLNLKKVKKREDNNGSKPIVLGKFCLNKHKPIQISF